MIQNAFADTSFWIAFVLNRDRFHSIAREWLHHVSGSIVTTDAVLIETANAMARPQLRRASVELIERIRRDKGIDVHAVDEDLWERGFQLYRSREDKSWGLTDCISFVVMSDSKLHCALTSDSHFAQAGFRALLLEDPPA